ncbi:serine/threonine protein kinase [Actinoplanes sp. KI2]|uniref:serine/threonine-protein kinase n=1 Tax=Actinoplanes sp. KI2 TaxID=2983315 RepID=UPI0021D5D070|nr:serine/threonine-protein kinase [Actinoplanes sp. KI2]MCU7723156.1 serine/threonine protein kinase [Actinoplanes sp. KI2]
MGPPPLIGGRYRLVEKLGTGGMSVVWRGYDETLGRSVAVKVLSPRLADDQGFRDRLRQEALAAARLCHPHITGIFDFGESPLDSLPDTFSDARLTVPYVVMELNDGESVAARLGRQGPLPWREAVTVAVEVASALATAHARGLVHRDVTPANVMLTVTGAKVVDFGISAIVGERDAAPDGSLLGTPAYLAPERLAGAQVSAATDVYALGLLLYRLLTGRLPWPAGTTAEALRAHLYADPDPLPSLPGMPGSVGELCLRCLAKSPADRPDAAAVARALADTAGIQPVLPPARAQAADAPPPARAVVPLPTVSRWQPSPGVASSGWFTPGVDLSGWFVPGAASSGRLVPGAVSSGRLVPGAVSSGRLVPGGVSRRWRELAGAASFRLRAGLRLAGWLRLGQVRPLGGGLFAGGGLAREVLTGRHRVQAALLTAGLLAVAGVGWATTRETQEPERAQAAGAGPDAVGPPETSCVVRYQLRHDSGRDYEAVLTVATSDEVGRSSWRVVFAYPGSQRLTGAPAAVTQTGRKVIVKGHGSRKAFTLRGAYRGDNPLPLAFTLDGRRCRAEVLGSTVTEPAAGTISEAAGERRTPDAKRDRPSPPRKQSYPSKPVTPPPSLSPKPHTGTDYSVTL